MRASSAPEGGEKILTVVTCGDDGRMAVSQIPDPRGSHRSVSERTGHGPAADLVVRRNRSNQPR